MKKTVIKCIVCECDINEIYYDGKDKSPLHSRMWNDGAVDVFSCGYGSRLDMYSYTFGICDNCIEIKATKGIINRYGRT